MTDEDRYGKFSLQRFKMGYFIQYKSLGGFVGDAIEDEQLSKGFNNENAGYVHVEVSGGDQHSVNIRPFRSVAIDIRKVHGGRYCRLTKYRGYDDDPNDRLRLKVAYFSAQLCNRKYDWLGVIKFKLPFFFHVKNLFFCSEGASWALKKVFPEALKGLASHRWMPADFSDQRYFEIVWQGVIPSPKPRRYKSGKR